MNNYLLRPLLVLMILSINVLWSQENEAEFVEIGKLKRLYKVSDSLYRSEQPNKKEFAALESLGIKTVLNFRRNVKDDGRTKKTDLFLIHQPLKAKTLTEDEIIEGLINIHKADKPVLVHCWHGSDRTGAMVAAYRIIFDNWTKEAAIKEFRLKQFGYHEDWFPNLIELLENLDVQKVKELVFTNGAEN